LTFFRPPLPDFTSDISDSSAFDDEVRMRKSIHTTIHNTALIQYMHVNTVHIYTYQYFPANPSPDSHRAVHVKPPPSYRLKRMLRNRYLQTLSHANPPPPTHTQIETSVSAPAFESVPERGMWLAPRKPFARRPRLCFDFTLSALRRETRAASEV